MNLSGHPPPSASDFPAAFFHICNFDICQLRRTTYHHHQLQIDFGICPFQIQSLNAVKTKHTTNRTCRVTQQTQSQINPLLLTRFPVLFSVPRYNFGVGIAYFERVLEKEGAFKRVRSLKQFQINSPLHSFHLIALRPTLQSEN